MKLTCYASGSTGNLYALEDGQTRLLIEAGLPLKEMQRLTNHTLSTFEACLLSHHHGDHANGAWDMARRGIAIRASKDTLDYIGMHRTDIISPGVEFSVGAFQVIPFAVPHTVPCFGFIIKSSAESMIFMTDLSYCPSPFLFSPTIFALECNYSADLIPADCPREESIFGAHMSLDTCIKTLKANDLSKTREIWLLHISQRHGDPERFVREVQSEFGIPTFAAPAYTKRWLL